MIRILLADDERGIAEGVGFLLLNAPNPLAKEGIEIVGIAEDGEEGIATARSYQKPDGVWVLGRVAVLKERRGHRLGSRAVQELEEYLRGLDAKEIELSAQLHAMKMYEALGYKEEGDLIYDEGQPHKMMRKFL